MHTGVGCRGMKRYFWMCLVRAIAFRLLGINGYDISSGELAEFDEKDYYFDSVSPQFTDTKTILELYRASQIKVEYALQYPHGSMERIQRRIQLEQYHLENIQLLKTSYRCSNIDCQQRN